MMNGYDSVCLLVCRCGLGWKWKQAEIREDEVR